MTEKPYQRAKQTFCACGQPKSDRAKLCLDCKMPGILRSDAGINRQRVERRKRAMLKLREVTS